MKKLTVLLALGDGDRLRVLYQVLGHIGEKLFHAARLLAYTPAFFSRARTVSVG